MDAAALELPENVWFPEIVLVVEGDARAVEGDAAGAVRIVRAAGAGDDAIVEVADGLRAEGRAVTAVTSDRELTGRLERSGASVRSVSWLRDLL